MPRIRTEELLSRLEKGDFKTVRLKGLQGGSFFMMLECDDGVFIHENVDGSMKEYTRADFALSWLKRKSGLKEVIVDIDLWQNDLREKY